jgi:hypothetical protein
MLALAGSRVWYRTVGHGVFHCERCGGDRPYRHRSGRRWAHLLGVPVAALGSTGEHLRCVDCRTCYRVELLAVPTMEQMLVALLAATKAAVLAMLRAGGAGSPAARRRGIAMIRAAGAPDFHDERLAAALGEPAGAREPERAGGPDEDAAPKDRAGCQDLAGEPPIGLRPAIEGFAVQLDLHAREWFLAKVVEIGLADGALSPQERAVAATVARYLGMSASRGDDVISLAEQAAQAG